MDFTFLMTLVAGILAGWWLALRLNQHRFRILFRDSGLRSLEDVASTLQKTSEKVNDLTRSVEELRRIIEDVGKAPLGVIQLNEGGQITQMNDAASDLVGARIAPLGRFQWEVIPSASLASFIQNAFKGQEIAQECFSSKDGIKAEFARVTVVPFQKPPGGAFIFLQDVKPEEEWRRRKEEMVQALSHELKTPITVISGYMEMLLDAIPDTNVRTEIIQPLQKGVENLRNLVHDVMTLYRLESTPIPAFQRIPIQEIVEQVIQLLTPVARQRNVTLHWDVERPEPVLYGVPSDFQTMLTNLVQNAIVYNRENGTVHITGKKEGSHFVLEVRDTGIGISSRDLPRIFERFYRAEKGRSRDNGGTGLGLAIVKHIVERHNGAVSVESQLGKGAVFRVTLPLSILDRAAEPSSTETAVSFGSATQSPDNLSGEAA